jgi:serine/threonine-protein kinase
MPRQNQPNTIILDGQYRLISQLGDGGFAKVVRAEELESGKHVAIKILKGDFSKNPETVMRFQNEADKMKQMDHPNVLKVTDYGFIPEKRRHYFVMELIEGIQDVDEEICPKFPLENILEIGIQAANGLYYIHQNRLVHRDVKPDNLIVSFLDPDAVEETEEQILTDRKNIIVKVSDLGIAKDRDLTLTQTDTALGTPYYMSPEQAMETKRVNHKADIYALGATLYHYVTGEPPFSDLDSAMQIIMAKVHGELPKTPREIEPEIQIELERIIMKAMAADKFDRYPTMREFREDLINYSRGEEPKRLKTSFYGKAPRRIHRKRHKKSNHKQKNKSFCMMVLNQNIVQIDIINYLLQYKKYQKISKTNLVNMLKML